MRHGTSLINIQNGSRLGEGTCNSNKKRKRPENRRSQEATAIYLYSDETSALPIYSKTATPNTTPVMMMPEPRYLQSSSSRGWPSDYATVPSSIDNVDYCCLCRARSHCTSTSPLLTDATCKLIIKQRHNNLRKLSPRNFYRPGSRSPR